MSGNVYNKSVNKLYFFLCCPCSLVIQLFHDLFADQTLRLGNVLDNVDRQQIFAEIFKK